MTRIKEPKIGTTHMPEYKSPPSRIQRSLRKGYDNLREKAHKLSDTVLSLRGKLRDTQKSREEWKERAKRAEKDLQSFKESNIVLETQLEEKKISRNRRRNEK